MIKMQNIDGQTPRAHCLCVLCPRWPFGTSCNTSLPILETVHRQLQWTLDVFSDLVDTRAWAKSSSECSEPSRTFLRGFPINNRDIQRLWKCHQLLPEQNWYRYISVTHYILKRETCSSIAVYLSILSVMSFVSGAGIFFSLFIASG